MLRIAGQTAGPIGLKFVVDIYGWPGGVIGYKKFEIFFKIKSKSKSKSFSKTPDPSSCYYYNHNLHSYCYITIVLLFFIIRIFILTCFIIQIFKFYNYNTHYANFYILNLIWHSKIYKNFHNFNLYPKFFPYTPF